MRHVWIAYMLLVTGCKGGTTKTLPSDQPSSTTTEAERIVQQVVDAWNKHDVNGALAASTPTFRSTASLRSCSQTHALVLGHIGENCFPKNRTRG
jgi:hypothetical protein